jgi:hypothetical protein
MLGFYVFQTNLVDHMQNDALMYGGGLDMRLGSIVIENQAGGYRGYLDNGDRPLVLRLNLTWDTQLPLDLKVRFQKGFVDYSYTSLRITGLYNF